jgi:hypothetical protein
MYRWRLAQLRVGIDGACFAQTEPLFLLEHRANKRLARISFSYSHRQEEKHDTL